MSKVRYAAGDKVVLMDGPLRNARASNEFKVVAVLPDAYGQAQYRVRSEIEGFERRISAGDIDDQRSHASNKAAAAAPHLSRTLGQPWSRSLATKPKK